MESILHRKLQKTNPSMLLGEITALYSDNIMDYNTFLGEKMQKKKFDGQVVPKLT
jgi:hypothetical protein